MNKPVIYRPTSNNLNLRLNNYYLKIRESTFSILNLSPKHNKMTNQHNSTNSNNKTNSSTKTNRNSTKD